jgi:SAM-dependent methyltransferase
VLRPRHVTAPVAERLASMIDALVRAPGATPPPRGLPYLGLEHPSGTGLHLLEGLAARGIFRKYEHVLLIEAGLGGGARWLAARLGCTAVGTDTAPERARAAAELTRRSGLDGQVRFVAAAAGALPFRGARFTHAWLLETLARVPDARATLDQAFHALRPGGHLAVQELVCRTPPAPAVPGWRFRDADAWPRALAEAGFVEIERRDVSREAAERSARVTLARELLLRQLRARGADEPAVARLVDERDALAHGLAAAALGVVQLVAHRPTGAATAA